MDVAAAVGVSFEHPALLDYTAGAEHTGKVFADLTKTEQDDVREKSKERFLAYILLRQSAKQHSKLKMDLQNQYQIQTKENVYPSYAPGSTTVLPQLRQNYSCSYTHQRRQLLRSDQWQGRQEEGRL